MNHDAVKLPSPHTRCELGEQIRTARERAGISIEGLAEKLNLRVGFIQAVEEGRGGQHMDWAYERIHLRSIARILQLNLDAILEEGYRDVHEGA
jgi:cytoskeleton protein RodZ